MIRVGFQASSARPFRFVSAIANATAITNPLAHER